jgi:hypothetical protein
MIDHIEATVLCAFFLKKIPPIINMKKSKIIAISIFFGIIIFPIATFASEILMNLLSQEKK